MPTKQSRKWHLTINNPLKYGLTREEIKERLMLFKPNYFCICDEVGENATPHTHLFIYSTSPIRFETLKRRFEQAHIESAKGSAKQNRDYILKINGWEKTEKSASNIKDSFEEYGEMPNEKQETYPEYAEIIEDLELGEKTISEIVKEHPRLALKASHIEHLGEVLRRDKFSDEYREIEVNYLFSSVDVDLIGYIYQNHKPHTVCRITHYGKNGQCNFDSYTGQEVLLFDNFRSSISIEDMLVYLSPYPVSLPARYTDRSAAFTAVYIVSDIPPEMQYRFLEKDKDLLIQKFRNRIDRVIEFREDGEVVETEYN